MILPPLIPLRNFGRFHITHRRLGTRPAEPEHQHACFRPFTTTPFRSYLRQSTDFAYALGSRNMFPNQVTLRAQKVVICHKVQFCFYVIVVVQTVFFVRDILCHKQHVSRVHEVLVNIVGRVGVT